MEAKLNAGGAMRHDEPETFKQSAEKNDDRDHLYASVDSGREEFAAKQREQKDFIKAGGSSNITAEFGKLEILDGEKEDSKGKPEAPTSKEQKSEKEKSHGSRQTNGAVPECSGREGEDADREKERMAAVQILRDPHRAPIRMGDAHMTPMGAPTRPASSWDNPKETDAIPPDFVQPNYGPHLPAEQTWPVSDTMRDASSANNRPQTQNGATPPRRGHSH